MSALVVTQLRKRVTLRSSIGAGCYAITRLRASRVCMCAGMQAGACVRACMCVRVLRNCVIA